MSHELHQHARSADRKIHEAAAAAGDTIGRTAVEAGKRGWASVSETASTQVEHLKHQGEAVQRTVQRHPFTSTLIGFGLGIVVAGLWFRR